MAAGEAEQVDGGAGQRQRLGSFPMHHLEQVLRKARLRRQLNEPLRGQGRFRRRLGHHRIARGDGGAELVAQQVEGIVERRDRRNDARRHIGNDRLAIGSARHYAAMQHLPVEESSGVARELQRVLRPPHLVAGLGDGLADFRADELRHRLRLVTDRRGKGIQQIATLSRSGEGEFRLSSPSVRHSTGNVIGARHHDAAHRSTVIGRGDLDAVGVVGLEDLGQGGHGTHSE